MRVVAVVGVIFAVACGLPTLRHEGGEYQSGIVCLLCGCFLCCPWISNPFLLFGCIDLMRGRNLSAFVFGVLASLCTVPFILNVIDASLKVSWGYYFWQADIFLFTIAAGILLCVYGSGVPSPTGRGYRR
jgi:hypothetical protein